MFHRHMVVPGLVLLTTAAFVATAGADPVHVSNPATPPGGVVTCQLQELWRVGGEDEDIIFGQVIRATVDDDDNIYLLDAQLCHVEVFDPQGKHLRTLSREGEGPGEIRQPADMIFLPDDTFGILTRFPGRLTKLDRDGNPAGVVMISDRDATEGGFTAAHYGAAAGDNLIIVGNEIRMIDEGRERTWFVGRYDLEGNEQVRFHSLTYRPDAGRIVLIERHILAHFLFACAPGSDGRVYIAPSRYDYAINVYAPDGSVEHVIEREYENRDRVEIEARRSRDILETWASRRGGDAEIEVEEQAASIMGLRVSDTGELWVENSRSGYDQAEGIFKTYDVFDREGRFARQVAVHCDGDPWDDQLFFLRDDLAVMIKDYHPTFYALMGRVAVEEGEDEMSNMEIVVYRVP